MIRKLIATTLEDISGYRLQEAGDGIEAVERAVDARPEIVFLDIDMPRLNGIETCRRLRSDPATAGATFVMLPGDPGDVAERGAQAAGAALFLTKPFSPLHLLRLVDRIGAARRAGAPGSPRTRDAPPPPPDARRSRGRSRSRPPARRPADPRACAARARWPV